MGIKFLLENARNIEGKIQEKFERVTISKDMTPTQREKCKTRGKNKIKGTYPYVPRQNILFITLRHPLAMETDTKKTRRLQVQYRKMLHLNKFTDSQFQQHCQSQKDPFNDTTIVHHETIERGVDYLSSQCWRRNGVK